MGRYVDPRTDFGWKFYFGREDNKILLIEFLNSLFHGEKIISDLRYKPIEQDGDYEEMRRVVFDLHCIGSDGEVFINKQLARGRRVVIITYRRFTLLVFWSLTWIETEVLVYPVLQSVLISMMWRCETN
ncbi:MAG: Rpn family recombination-promoting nuclease/putative transposase [Sphingobacterium sp.]|nr:Rpn family recombination-promoting nuclease/putative transposase [Sphingobacterium sp.]